MNPTRFLVFSELTDELATIPGSFFSWLGKDTPFYILLVYYKPKTCELDYTHIYGYGGESQFDSDMFAFLLLEENGNFNYSFYVKKADTIPVFAYELLSTVSETMVPMWIGIRPEPNSSINSVSPVIWKNPNSAYHNAVMSAGTGFLLKEANYIIDLFLDSE